MPTSDFTLKTEYVNFSKALIVDEVGEFPTFLVDLLMSHGCGVSYFGKERKENFHYLFDKNNFSYHDALEDGLFERLEYLFYFPSEKFSEFERIFSLIKTVSTKILVCVPLEFLKKETISKLSKEKQQNIRIVYYDSLFGPRIRTGFLANLFRSAIREKKLVVESDPAEEIAPLPAKEAARELIRLIFSPDTENKEFLLCPSEKLTLFAFVSEIKKVLPEINLIFSGSNYQRKNEFKGREKLKINFSLEEAVQETIDWFRRIEKPVQTETLLPEATKELVEEPKLDFQPTIFLEPPNSSLAESGEAEKLDFLFAQKKEKSLAKPLTKNFVVKKIIFGIAVFLLLIFVFFLFPIGLSVAGGFLGVNKVVHIKELVEKGNFSSATSTAQQAKRILSFSRRAISVSAPFYNLLGFRGQIEIINETFPLLENLIDSMQFSLFAAQQAERLEESFFKEEEVDWDEVLSPVRADLCSAYEQASLAQASFAKTEPLFKFFKQTTTFKKIEEVLPKSREVLLKAGKFVSVLPKILGTRGIKTYLVLFQNNMELRPTGGFIGSYGILRLENGKLINFEVFDVYQADGQLKGHVEPPIKLKEYLGEAAWYLRDSNWDPDFPVSAKRAQWFLDKETQIVVDGTIAINLEVVKKLLEALGEIEVSDYQEKINAGNVFQKAEYYSELGTFPGSTQKRDFLASLTWEIFEELRRAKTDVFLNVAGAIFSSLEQKEIMFYFNDPQVEQVIAELQWEGSIRNYQSHIENDLVFTDYLFINEANVGINKSNYYLRRKIDHQIIFTEKGEVQEKLILTYENLSPSENWPAGRYKNYLRVYLKKNALVSSVFIDDPANPGLWLPFDPALIDRSEEHGKTVYGFIFEVPIKSQRKIEVNYSLAEPLSFSSKLTSYLLMVQKQSGAYPSTYDLTIKYPTNFIPLRVIPSAVVGDSQLLVSGKLVKDLIYQVDLAH